MFVRYATTVGMSLGEVERRLDDLRANLEEWADIAYREGERTKAKVGPTGSIAKSVSLEVGRPEVQRRGVTYPIRWTANGAGALFPDLKAELVLSQLGPDHTTVAMDGTYDPPMGSVGRLIDRALMGRVAEATVRNWVDRLVGEISSAGTREG
jgi:hypothetical protein